MKLRFNLMISICLLALLTGCREMPPIEWAENPPPNAQIFSGPEMKTGDTWVYKYTAMDIQDVQVKAGIFQAMHVFYTHQSVDSGRSWEREFWYSPEVRALVLQDNEDWRYELIEFKPGE